MPSAANPIEEEIEAQEALCGRAPRAAGPWAALARLLLAAGRAAEAVAAAEAALARDRMHAGARTVRKAAVEVLQAADPALSALELAAALDPADPAGHAELGHAYADLDRPADAERCFKRALAIDPGLAAARARLAALYLGVGIEDGAEHHARLALQAEPGQAVASQTLAAVLDRRGDHAAARRVLDAAYARQSLFIEPARSSPFTVLVLATRTSGNIPYRHIMPPTRYARLVWYMEHALEAQFDRLPEHAVILNAIGDADLSDGAEDNVRGFLAHARRPLLNDPDRVARTRRDRLPALLADIDGVVAPAVVRLEASGVRGSRLRDAAVEAGIEPPLLVRPMGSHGGRGLVRADSWEALDSLQAEPEDAGLYLNQYWDYRAPDGLFRKGRMIFVDRRPYPYHWAIGPDWMVHYDTAGMPGAPDRQAEEQRFLDDPEGLIGPRAWAAIARIGERLDLDYCGLDFSILPGGRVLVFEANPTMLVHPEDPDGELAYKTPAVQRIIDAFQARLHALAAPFAPAGTTDRRIERTVAVINGS